MGNAVKTLRKDVHLKTPDIIRSHGYPVETHKVVTDDGYRLTLHRIPGRNNRSDHGRRSRAVLVQHGLLNDSAVFVITGPGRGLAYLLADRGYDVWLGNSRGSAYSRDHVTLSPDAPDGKFWDFTWHEMGTFDLPAVTDYILKTAQKPRLTYVGYSQGCTQFFVMGSERSDYVKKIEAMFGLAPAMYVSHSRALVLREPWRTLLSPLSRKAELYKQNSVEDLLMKSTARNKLACKASVTLMGIFAGANKKQVDFSMVPAFFAVFPSSAGSRQVAHYQQLFLSGGFRQFDHGPERNLQLYGLSRPPDYDLSKVTCPVTLYYSLNDYMSDPADVKKAYEELVNPAGLVSVPLPEFTHMDFLWAKDVKKLLYDDLLDRIDAAAPSLPRELHRAG